MAEVSPLMPRPAGVCHAETADGVALPVIDVTHPAFELDPGDAVLARLEAAFVRESRRRAAAPAPVRWAFERIVMPMMVGRTVLGRGLRQARGGFLSGLNTYLMKLGPDHLGAAAPGRVNRAIAASFPAYAMRLRLQDMARLLADGVAPALAAAPGRPLVLANIAGGPGPDSWNALILLRRDRPELLDGRRVTVLVLDLQEEGPAFGARALDALRAPGGPLAGVDATFSFIRYDWSDPRTLAPALAQAGAATSVIGISSEGGLFEYGSDEAITANLLALRAAAPGAAVFAGSVTRDDGAAIWLKSASAIPTRPRSEEGFAALARAGGWTITTTIPRPFSRHVSLIPA